MPKNPQFQRFLIAAGVSVVLTGALLGLSMSINSAQHPEAMRLLQLLDKPSDAAVKWWTPSGHELGTFLSAAAIGLGASILFYAVLIWIIFNLSAWLRGTTVSARAVRSD